MPQTNRELPRLGAKVRTLRRRENLSQVQMAERLGISPSYLNLIESNRRPLPAALLIKLAQTFGVDVHAFGADEDAIVISDLLEAFSDPAFDAYQLTSTDVRDLAINHPQVARAVLGDDRGEARRFDRAGRDRRGQRTEVCVPSVGASASWC